MTGALDAPKTVLVVENEALVALMIAETLTEAGYQVVCAPDGRAAPSDAAVVNLRLAGGLDGRDVIRALRQQRPNLPVVVVTGYDLLAPEANLRGLGGPTARLGKPIDCEALLEYLARMLACPTSLIAPRRRLSDMAA